MNKLRVSNLKSYTSLPYRLLSSLDYVEYSESSPAENARMLHEGEVDIALIPATEFAIHGGYVGLDFGIAGVSKIDAVFLYGQSLLEDLHTVLLDANSNSSVCLLRLLFMEIGLAVPKLVRVQHDTILSRVDPGVGALVTGDKALNSFGEYPLSLDLAAEWFKLTKLPFVFCVWAARSNKLTRKIDSDLNTVFHRAITARQSLALASSSEVNLSLSKASTHISSTVLYKLDTDCYSGMSEFFRRAHKHNIIPDEPYRQARYSILSGNTTDIKQPKSLSSILKDAVDGRRISITDGVRLAEQGELADLALAADMIRSRIYDKRALNFAVNIDFAQFCDSSHLRQILEKLSSLASGTILLKLSGVSLQNFPWNDNFIDQVKRDFGANVEASTVPEVIAYSESNHIELSELVARLVTAGIDSVSSVGGEMLIDRAITSGNVPSYTASEWLSTVKWFHRYGASSTASLRFDIRDTWEDRIIHLQKLRSLQDETPGFRYFHLVLPKEGDQRLSIGDNSVLRAMMVGRLFLDNIPHFQETSSYSDPVSSMLSLSFGSSCVKVEITSNNQDEVGRAIDFLAALRDFGMDFEERAFAQTTKQLLN